MHLAYIIMGRYLIVYFELGNGECNCIGLDKTFVKLVDKLNYLIATFESCYDICFTIISPIIDH